MPKSYECSSTHMARVMRSCSQGRRRSVDRERAGRVFSVKNLLRTPPVEKVGPIGCTDIAKVCRVRASDRDVRDTSLGTGDPSARAAIALGRNGKSKTTDDERTGKSDDYST